MSAKDIAARRRIERLEAKHAVFASYCSWLRRRGLSPRTVESYADCLSIFADWLASRSPVSVTLDELEAFRQYLVTEHVGQRLGNRHSHPQSTTPARGWRDAR